MSRSRRSAESALFALACCFPGGRLLAQGLRLSLDLSAGLDGGVGRVAVAAFRHTSLAPDRWSVGAGLRATGYAGQVASFRNRGTVSGNLAANVPIDPLVSGLNVAVATDIRIAGPVHLEFNLDVAGVAVGPTRRSGNLEAKPATGSLFLYASRDRGSLNSELAVSIALSRRLRLRGGLSHYVLGYRVTDTVAIPGDRFGARYQKFFTAPFVAVGFAL